MSALLPTERIERSSLMIRGHRVMLDADLAALYGVSVSRLNESVKRNRDRFPADFMFQLTHKEFDSLRSQFATLKLEIADCDIKFGLGRPASPALCLYRTGCCYAFERSPEQTSSTGEYRNHARLCPAPPDAGVECPACPQTGGFGEKIRRSIQSCVRCHPAAHDGAGAEQTKDRVSG